MKQSRIVSPGPSGKITNEYGEIEKVPEGWIFLPAGDAAITRKVTAGGAFWRVQVKKGRRLISKGVWAPEPTIREAQQTVKHLRTTNDYQLKRAAALRQRDKKQARYVEEFTSAIAHFLNFDPKYHEIEQKLACAVCEHAIPIGSGTVARTSMISIEERASRAVIAWMRHRTTSYDTLKIPRIKGERKAVRRMLASHSQQILKHYRLGLIIPKNCPLQKALK